MSQEDAMRRPLMFLRRRHEPDAPISVAEGVGFENPLQTRLKVRRREEARYLS
jgi:hypothetical protein